MDKDGDGFTDFAGSELPIGLGAIEASGGVAGDGAEAKLGEGGTGLGFLFKRASNPPESELDNDGVGSDLDMEDKLSKVPEDLVADSVFDKSGSIPPSGDFTPGVMVEVVKGAHFFLNKLRFHIHLAFRFQ